MGAPGYKKIVIHPDYGCGLRNVKASYNSIYGKISVEWKRIDEKLYIQVEIPPNTTAEIYLGDKIKTVGSGKYEIISL